MAAFWTAGFPDLSGQTVIVTGASSGIGRATASALAHAGARVVLAVRDLAKGEAVAAAIAGASFPPPESAGLEARELDLASLDSVRGFAAAWRGEIDLLINNAGVMVPPLSRTADGFELQFGTNHLGHFVLTNLLLPSITGRVVTVSSSAHQLGRIPGGSFVGPRGFLGLRGAPKVVARSAAARDPVLARRLWTASEELTGVRFPEMHKQ